MWIGTIRNGIVLNQFGAFQWRLPEYEKTIVQFGDVYIARLTWSRTCNGSNSSCYRKWHINSKLTEYFTCIGWTIFEDMIVWSRRRWWCFWLHRFCCFFDWNGAIVLINADTGRPRHIYLKIYLVFGSSRLCSSCHRRAHSCRLLGIRMFCRATNSTQSAEYFPTAAPASESNRWCRPRDTRQCSLAWSRDRRCSPDSNWL